MNYSGDCEVLFKAASINIDQPCDVINVFIVRNGHVSCSPGMSTTSSSEAVGSRRTSARFSASVWKKGFTIRKFK